jgi:hypothetical protein
MSGTNMIHVGSKLRAGRLYAAAAVVVLVVVVAAGYGLMQSTNPGVATGRVPAATPSPTATVITGTETCSAGTGATTTTLNGVKESRGERYDCTTTTTDPRLTGRATTILNSELLINGTWLGWGTREIKNVGGTWSGLFSSSSAVGSTASATTAFDVALTGEDGYDGLLFLGKAETSSTTTQLMGVVLPVGPAVTGHSTCEAILTGTDTQVGDITATRGYVLDCPDSTADKRISGSTTVQISLDVKADGSAEIWGTMVTRNTGGTWEGIWSGTVDPGFTTHHMEMLLHGTGEYAGLFLRQSTTGDNVAGYETVSRIYPAD